MMRKFSTTISKGVCQSPQQQDKLQRSLTREALKQRIVNSFRNLEAQAQRVNQLSSELEAEICELKALASQINQDRLLLEGHPFPSPLEMNQPYLSLPMVQSHPNYHYKLKSRFVDLFQAEREADILAQELRKWSKRKHRQR